MYSDRKENGQKPPRTKPSRQTTPWQDPPDKIPREQLRQNLYNGAFVQVFCTKPSKNRGVRDVWRTFGGGPGMCDEVWQGEGVKIGQK